MEHKKEFDHDDPFELKAVEISGGDLEFQARAFITEFLSLEKSRDELIGMFNDRFYAGMYHLTVTLGVEKIIDLIDEELKQMRSIHYKVSEQTEETSCGKSI